MALSVYESGVPISSNKDHMNRPFSIWAFQDYLEAKFGLNGDGFLELKNDQSFGVKTSLLYKTGNEEKLKAWIMSRPDNSIAPDDLLKESVILNKGNVWNALLCAHDLLRNNARYYHSDRYVYPTTKTEVEKLFNKLIDIRGDLVERGAGFNGDHGGTWYRIYLFYLLRLVPEGTKQFDAVVPCAHAVAPPTQLDSTFHPILNYLMDLALKDIAWTAEGSKEQINEPERDEAGKYVIDGIFAKSSASFVAKLWYSSPIKFSDIKMQQMCKQRRYLQSDFREH